ncbi:MAG: tetratricopeptide repeat protein [Pirellulales bacterium]|nr:tetratricopeptide repeat protein [Pirellulales bacterium]
MTIRIPSGAKAWSMAIAVAASLQLAAAGQAPTGAPPAGAPPAGAQPGGATAEQPAAGQQDPFTVENLIGDAVSLSNQQYPEVDQAIKRFKNSDPVGAREYLDQAKQKYPKLPPVDLLMAKLWVFARNGDNARAALEQTVARQPDDPEAYLLLADLAFAEGRTTEAHALFEKAQSLVGGFNDNPKRKNNFEIRVLAGLSAVFERRQQWDKAIPLLSKWVELDPDSAAAHTRMGITLFQMDKPQEALAEFKKARELRPDSSHPSVMLGQLFTQKNQIDKARAAFEQAYKEDAKNEATARAYAEWLIQQGEFDKAQQVAAAMRKSQPNSVAALMLDGVVAKMRNQPEAAEEALTKVLSIDPSNAGAINLLALILSESSNLAQQEKALRYAQMNAERFPNNAQANIPLAWILAKLNRTAESDSYLNRAVQSGNLNADSAFLVARILVSKGQKDQARKAIEQVLAKAGSGMFMFRKEAEAMLKDLGGSVPQSQAPAASAPPAGGAAAPGAGPAPRTAGQ